MYQSTDAVFHTGLYDVSRSFNIDPVLKRSIIIPVGKDGGRVEDHVLAFCRTVYTRSIRYFSDFLPKTEIRKRTYIGCSPPQYCDGVAG
jgi:hypothetical protein